MRVSVIVPIYNVEKYLNRCIDSIVCQTYKDLQIILVNDGSPDNSKAIMEDYSKKDCRIKCIYKSNGGLSSARNAGIDVATGEYILFVDSDDWLETNAISELVGVVESSNYDMVMFDYSRCNGEAKINISKELREGFFSKEDIEKEIYSQLIMKDTLDYGPILSAWSILYRYDFISQNNLKFDEEIKWSEDNLFNSIAMYNCSSFYYMKNSFFYNYFYNDNSITTTFKKDSLGVYILMNEKLEKYFGQKDGYNFTEQLNFHQVYYALNYFAQIRSSSLNNKEKRMYNNQVYEKQKIKKAFRKLKINKLDISWKLKLVIYMHLIKFKFIRGDK